MTKEEEAAKLVVTIENSFKKGYLYYALTGKALLNTEQVLRELIANEEITIIEPDGQYTPIFHAGGAKR